MIEKKCKTCKETKAIEQFTPNKRSKDGYGHECMACKDERERRMDIIFGKFDDYLNLDVKPSEVDATYWIRARIEANYPESTDRSGKWLIFAEKGDKLDTIWQKVREALYKGLLGVSAKVSTAKENPHATSKRDGVICVYTYSLDDLEDVRRVRQNLRNIGIIWKIPYKLDSDIGKYQVQGDTKISKLYE